MSSYHSRVSCSDQRLRTKIEITDVCEFANSHNNSRGETWTLVAEAFVKPKPIVKDEGIYNARRDKLISIIRKTRDAHMLLVVGRNPGLHDLAVGLIASGDEEARELVHEKLPTSGLVVIDLPFDEPLGGIFLDKEQYMTWLELCDASGR